MVKITKDGIKIDRLVFKERVISIPDAKRELQKQLSLLQYDIRKVEDLIENAKKKGIEIGEDHLLVFIHKEYQRELPLIQNDLMFIENVFGN